MGAEPLGLIGIAIGIITLTYSKSADSSHTFLDKKETINLKDVK